LASPPLAALLVGHVALLRCPSSRFASDGDAGAKRLSCFPDGVPANSVLREFIGGSGFAY